MKALILAAGYGTRLQRDLRNDQSGNYNELLDVPKPLLPIGTYPLCSHLMMMLKKVDSRIDKVYLVSNKFYEKQFLRWAEEWPELEVICDGSLSNEDRPGAVGCILLSIQSASIQDDLLVLGGDTLFHEDFSIKEFVDCFDEKSNNGAAALVTTVKCSDEDTWKTGIAEVEEDGRMSSFLEKVGPVQTLSRLSVPCFYLLSKGSLHLIGKFLEEMKEQPLSVKDAPGHFIKYLSEREPVYTFPVSGRFDVGSLSSYVQCHSYFTKREASSHQHSK